MAADWKRLSRVLERLARTLSRESRRAPATAVKEGDAATQALLVATRKKVELARLRRELAELQRLENVPDTPKIQRWLWERRWLVAGTAVVVPFAFPSATGHALSFLSGTLATIAVRVVHQMDKANESCRVQGSS